jgi:ABC-type nickel/cobalt efflux system permease component RcnA
MSKFLKDKPENELGYLFRSTLIAKALAELSLVMCLFILSSAAFAHPMGNFSINHYSKIEAGEKSLKLKYIIDMAEIPTFGERMEMDINQDKIISIEEQNAYLSRKSKELKKGLNLKLNDNPLELIVMSSNMVFLPGAGGLPTTKITIEYETNFEKDNLVGVNNVFYMDENYPGRTGWKEIIVLGKKGESYIVNSSATSTDISNELSSYPTDAISSPPQDLQANFSFSLGIGETGTASSKLQEKYSKSPRVKTPRNSFTDILERRDLTFGIVLFSLVVAFGFGAFHALSPGHGKTIVAAYLVGSRGTVSHALLLGIIVTLTHTIGVFALGLVTLYASRYILPEKLYPWLGFVSGMMIVVIGIVLFLKRFSRLRRGESEDHDPSDGHSHSYDHAHQGSHSQSHHSRSHDQNHEHSHHHDIPERVTFSGLFALGVSGGIVPCPEALIVLISAISLHRIGFGLVLIVAFSIGLALVLMGIGLTMVYAKRFMERFSGEGKIIRGLPLLSSVIITILGFGIAIQSLISGGIIQLNMTKII